MNIPKPLHVSVNPPPHVLDTETEIKGWPVWVVQVRITKVAGRWLQLSIKAGLVCNEAALLVRMFAVEHHILPVGNHGICNVKWPALHSTNNHTASLSRDETASCENEEG